MVRSHKGNKAASVLALLLLFVIEIDGAKSLYLVECRVLFVFNRLLMDPTPPTKSPLSALLIALFSALVRITREGTASN